jgi:hypothetical protein
MAAEAADTLGDNMQDARAGDRLLIAELLNTYSYAMLDRDFDAWKNCFTTDGHADYTTAGGVAGTPAEAAEWLKGVFGMFDISASQASNVVIEFTGDDTANVRSMYKMVMRIPGDTPHYMEACGWYRDKVKRTSDGWKIADRFEQLLYMR